MSNRNIIDNILSDINNNNEEIETINDQINLIEERINLLDDKTKDININGTSPDTLDINSNLNVTKQIKTPYLTVNNVASINTCYVTKLLQTDCGITINGTTNPITRINAYLPYYAYNNIILNGTSCIQHSQGLNDNFPTINAENLIFYNGSVKWKFNYSTGSFDKIEN